MFLQPDHVSAFYHFIRGRESPRDHLGEEMCGGPPQKQRKRPPPLPTYTSKLTIGLLDTYRKVNPTFVYVGSIQNPRRVLTKDARPGGNAGLDNKSSDLILTVGDVLCGPQGGHKFRVLDMLGQGTFGQVVKCRAEWCESEDTPPPYDYDDISISSRSKANSLPSSHMVAVKIVKNKPAYFNQAKVEIKVLKKVREELGDGNNPDDPGYSLIRLLYDFEYHHHLCMVFELMSVNLYELIKHQDFRGLPFARVQAFCTQLLDALNCLCQLGVIHCDLKPENILLENFGDPTTPRIKLIDLGSACYRDAVAFTYIQSRFYRAPEVLLGVKYSNPIDLWSLGCVAIELYMGLPVFPGVSAHNQLSRIVEMIGNPPSWMIEEGKKGDTFFIQVTKATIAEEDSGNVEFDLKEDYFTTNRKDNLASDEPKTKKTSIEQPAIWRIKTAQEWAFENGIRDGPEKTKRYVKEKTLPGIILRCEPKRRPKNEPVENIPIRDLECFIDFCSGLLRMDPNLRWTAEEALKHPFIRHSEFIGPFVPVKTPDIVEENEQDILFASPKMPNKPVVEMEVEMEEDDDDDHEVSTRIKTRATAIAIAKPIQHSNQYHSGVPLPQSASSSSQRPDKLAGLSSSQQQRFKRKLSEANASPGSSFSSVLGSPITRPEVPYPVAHAARWSDLGKVASPSMNPARHLALPPFDLSSPHQSQRGMVPDQFGKSLPAISTLEEIQLTNGIAPNFFVQQNSQQVSTTTSFWPFPSFNLGSPNKVSPPSILNHMAQQTSERISKISSSWSSSMGGGSPKSPASESAMRMRSHSDGAQPLEPLLEIAPKAAAAASLEATPSVEKSLAKWAPFDASEEEKD